MIRTVLFLLFFGVVTTLGFCAWKLTRGPIQEVPYPYVLTAPPKINTDELALIQDAQVLIIGDRMAKHLARFKEDLSKALSKDFSAPLKVVDLAQEHEGLHRTLQRLKSLKKTPRIVIYTGGSEEFFEQKIPLKYLSFVKRNLERYQNPKLRTLIYFAPILSRLIYQEYPHLELGPTPAATTETLAGADFQKQSELIYTFYQLELQELIRWAQQRDIFLLLVSSPIDLEIRPRQVCENALSQELLDAQKQVLALIEKNDFKSAAVELERLAPMAPGNGMNHFLSGHVARNLGNFEQAKEELTLAAAYDCFPWRSSPVFNSILINQALENELPYIDFQRLVYDQWNRNILFSTELFPQDLYYQKLITVMANKILPIIGSSK